MTMCEGDQGCIELCLDGHPEAFRGLVGRYQGRLVAYLAGRWSGIECAEYGDLLLSHGQRLKKARSSSVSVVRVIATMRSTLAF